jgi:eukaryotic-like serine/threonine-protein kinase
MPRTASIQSISDTIIAIQMIGETLGQYRIDARLGAGGMGVVYRAHDDRLHRIVALKLLGGEGGEGRETAADEREKLLDEARAASHLNHPHICTVYEVGEIGGRAFIAMEFVEGNSLAQLIPADGLPAETVVRYGVQIAGALAHAHERGVVHRDLKTANVAVNPTSGAKVLDFGLARRIGAAAVDGATRSVRMIEPGVLVGTLPYVAPEILGGQGTDTRTDIWALGVVLYEMATGGLPFQGRGEYELTASILRSPPQPFPAHVPAILRAIILRCLAKEPGQRYQRAGEVRAALEAIHSDLVIAPAAPRRTGGRLLLAVAGIVALGLALLVVWLSTRPAPPPPDTSATTRGRLSRVVSSSLRAFDPAISPDGRMIAYVAENPAGRFDVYTTRVAGGAHVRLTDDATRELLPRFSPDGERVAFTAVDGSGVPTIRIVPALGGPAVGTIPAAGDAAWSPDGRRLVYVGRDAAGRSQLVVSGADGSDARTILRIDPRYPFLRHPSWSVDGSTIAVVRGTGGVAGEIWLLPAAGGEGRAAIREPESVFSDWPTFSGDGQRLVHASNRGGATNIWSLPLSGGAPVQLTTGAGPDESPSISRDGTVAYVNSRWHNTLEVHDLRRGTQRTLLTHSPYIWAPDISPDGREITFSRNDVDGAWHLWTASLEDGAVRQLTSGQNGEVYPRYTRDGSAITFHSWNAPRRIGRVAPAGGPVTWLSDGAAGETFADPSPDGRLLAFVRTDPDAERVYVSNADGTGVRRLTPGRSTLPRWSPDGSRLAFAGDRRYSAGIFVINPDGSGVRQVSKDGGWPVWWPDGRSLAFLVVGADGHARIRVVSLADGATRMLESVRLDGSNHPFAITRDGQRIVVGNAVHDADEIWVIGR